MLKISVILLLLAPLAMGATIGDPLDTNDSWEEDCSYAEAHPACEWCWTKCTFAIIFTSWSDSNWDWNS